MTDNSNEIYGVIYKATDPNGKCYIGKRKGNGKDVGAKYFGSGVCIKRTIKEQGTDYFNYCIIDTGSSKEDLDEKEIHYIKFFNSTTKGNGYNLALGGNGGDLTLGMSDEELLLWKAKLSVSQKRVQGTPEQRKKNSEAQKIAQNKPGARERMSEIIKLVSSTPEHRKKLSTANKLAQGTPEQRKKNSEAQKIAQNRPEVKKRIAEIKANKSEEEKERIKKKQSDSHKGVKLGPQSEEHRNRLSLSHIGIKHTEESKEKRRYNAHIRWHIKRNTINPNCKFCVEIK